MPFHLVALLAVLALLACGDGGTEPTPDPSRPSTVTVTPAHTDLSALGSTIQLTAEVRDQYGGVVSGAAVTWASADTMVAGVDSVGLVTAVGNGTATITATTGSVSGRGTVTVAQEVGAVTVSPETATVAEGDTLRLTATAADANGHPVSDVEFAWSSGDTSVATVDSTGLVTAVRPGETGIVATASSIAGTAQIRVASPDRAVLLTLYEATGGPRWTHSDNWATDAPLRTWWGIRLNDRERVQQLHLSRNNLSGSIPPEIAGLTDLELLNLSGNNLSGLIPPDIGALSGLRWLYLQYNSLSGPIPPEIGAMTSLESLALIRNNLTGSIPPDIGALIGLRWLYLQYNGLSGPIPPEIGDLTALEILYLQENDLSGPIPRQLGQLLNLQAADFRNNDLTGPIPPQLGSLANLRSLRIGVSTFGLGGPGVSGLTGPIPPELGQLANLRQLDLWRNRLTGPIPPELGRLEELEQLLLGNNNLSGPIPPELGDLANLRTLYLTGNRLTGPIPPELGKLANLEGLFTQFTSVTTIPPELGNLGKLKYLILGIANLSGPIPPELGKLSNLESVNLQWGNLTGPIPPEFGNLSKLRRLHLNVNALEGPVPAELGGLSELEEMDLGRNRLTGPIPAELGGLKELERLLLYSNQLTSIPDGIAGMENLVSVHLRGNLLTSDGLPPGVFSGLPRLELVDLRQNRLTYLPAGLFLGTSRLSQLRLDQNPGAPFTLTLEALRVDGEDPSAPGPASIEVHMRDGAPLDLTIPLTAHGGAVSANSVVLETGSDRSTGATVTRDAGSRTGTEVVMGPIPALPHRLSGLRLDAAGSLILFGGVSNRAPVAKRNLPWMRMRQGDEPRGLRVSSYFDDPDADELDYSAVSDDPGLVSVTVAGDQLTVTPSAPGATTITVTATDPGGLAARSELTVSVRGVRRGSYAIDLIMVDPPDESVEAAFDDAVEYWESILADTELPDIPIGTNVALGCRGVTTDQSLEVIDDLAVVASVGQIDGPGDILGWAALCGMREQSRLPLIGALRFDAADLDVLRESDAMEEVIIHEIGHLLGIGTVWDQHGLLINPSLPDSLGADTHFRGPLAIAAFDKAGGEIYTGGERVPVENFAGRGSADSHWRESVLDRELMTPALSVGVPNPLSAITIQSLADMGYTVDVSLAEPFRLPGAADRAPGEDVRKIEYGDDVRRGRILVFGINGRVVSVIPN